MVKKMEMVQEVGAQGQPKQNKIKFKNKTSWMKKGVLHNVVYAACATLAYIHIVRLRVAFPLIFPGSSHVTDDATLLESYDTTRIWIPEEFNTYSLTDKLPEAYISTFTEKKPNTFAALWIRPYAENPPKTILYLHGNVQSAEGEIRELRELAELSNANVLCVEYPLYGVMRNYKFKENPVTSIHKVINQWAQSSYNFVKSMGFQPESITLFGYSLGTGPALELGANLYQSGEKVNSIALFAPFTNLKAVAKAKFHFAEPFVQSYWDNMVQIKRLKASNIPLIIHHAETDEMIPFAQGKQLYDAYDGLKLDIFWQPGGHTLHVETIAMSLQTLWARKDD